MQALIADAHQAAAAAVVAFMEREVAATRTGASGRDGAVAQVDFRGPVATAFDHTDSRAGGPHLHTHVVISNRVQSVLDGKWRSLDGRPMHAAPAALSQLHETVFADHPTRMLGVSWEAPEQGRDRSPAWAVASAPEELVKEQPHPHSLAPSCCAAALRGVWFRTFESSVRASHSTTKAVVAVAGALRDRT